MRQKNTRERLGSMLKTLGKSFDERVILRDRKVRCHCVLGIPAWYVHVLGRPNVHACRYVWLVNKKCFVQ